MATLVLSTIGNALGGPAGSAIGALIGQSIDQELLAPIRKGPRVGDLAVQTSSYGTQIPRIYGTMRVAGSVVWSTELIEHQQAGGAKGQPDVTYSYTVSFAVALSSRPAKAVKRIWADGNLLRGAAGDFKVPCKFRFYAGDQDQPIDPLIGSIEGISNTTAHRGTSLAVFEDLELATFGNRVPFLTFEIDADDAPPSLASVLRDATRGLIDSDRAEPLSGFAAYGSSMADALGSLVDTYSVDLFDDGSTLRSPASVAPVTIADADLGNSTDGQAQPRVERQLAPAAALPASLRLTYYDPGRDYQTGEARAHASEQPGKETQVQLPVVLGAADAKSLAQDVLARTFAERDTITLRLPPSYLGLEPGSRLDLPVSPAVWKVHSTKVDGFVVVVELRPVGGVAGAASISADPGRVAANPDVELGQVTLALIDVPNVSGTSTSAPVVLLAASSAGAGWKRSGVEISFGGQSVPVQTAAFKSVLGHASAVLPDSAPELIDQRSVVDVQLIDADQWLTSCDDDALAAGANLAVLGGELIQFGEAVSLGGGQFRLSRLLRGRGGTEWATVDHVINEIFCLLSSATLQPLTLPSWSVGATITASTGGSPDVSASYAGENVRPLTPVGLNTEWTSDGSLQLGWIRRSRQGFAWIDGIDAPLGETQEQYRIVLTCGDKAAEYLASQPALTVAAADLSTLGSGEIGIEVQQIGDFAASRPARITINYP